MSTLVVVTYDNPYKVQRAGFDPTLNVQEEQRLIDGNTEFALLLDCCPLLRIEEAGRRRARSLPRALTQAVCVRRKMVLYR
jgi:hypothetical protein